MEDWTNRSNMADDSNPLSRVHSSSNNNRSFYTSRTSNGKATARPLRPITTPTSSLNNVPTMPIPIPVIPGTIPGNTLPSAPASPPTPAPSPTPGQRAPDWSTAAPGEEHGDVDLDLDASDETSTNSSSRGYSFGYRHMRAQFASMENSERQRLLAELLNMCDGKLLGFVAGFVGPRLKRDPFSVLPNELCLRILTFVDDATALARSASVSRRWRELVGDDMAWKSMCERFAFRRMSEDQSNTSNGGRMIPQQQQQQGGGGGSGGYNHPYGYNNQQGYTQAPNSLIPGLSSSAPDLTRRPSLANSSTLPPTLTSRPTPSSRPRNRGGAPTISYRSHFKQRYQVETAWRSGGHVSTRQITPDQGVVTSLHLTPTYIIVALDNAKIHVFDTSGRHLRCLQGHVMGVWAMVPIGDTLVSGGCDRDVRVWDLNTGVAVHMLRGHTSTGYYVKGVGYSEGGL
ncbi:hypothetical protein LTR17_023770 [Elasticomyces elasticus]|nr:hypothetical protein LTR17_023770 [Elasticomyces elasticus]